MPGFGGDPNVSILSGISGGMLRGEEERKRREQEAFLNQLRMAAEGRARSGERRAEGTYKNQQTVFAQEQEERTERRGREQATVESFRAITQNPEDRARLNERGYNDSTLEAITSIGDPDTIEKILTTPYTSLDEQTRREIERHIKVSEGTLATDVHRAAAVSGASAEASAAAYARHRPPGSGDGDSLSEGDATAIAKAKFRGQPFTVLVHNISRYRAALDAGIMPDGSPMTPQQRAGISRELLIMEDLVAKEDEGEL